MKERGKKDDLRIEELKCNLYGAVQSFSEVNHFMFVFSISNLKDWKKEEKKNDNQDYHFFESDSQPIVMIALIDQIPRLKYKARI